MILNLQFAKRILGRKMAVGQKPKVAFFIYRSPEEAEQLTGGTQSNLALLSNLPEHDVLVIANAHDILEKELARRNIQCVVLDERELSWANVRKNLPTLVKRVGKVLRYNARVAALCVREGVDVLQCDEAALLFVGPGAKLSGSKLVAAYRNHPGVLPPMNVAYKIAMPLVDRMVATSELLKKAVVDQGWGNPAARIERIYNGIDVQKVNAELMTRNRGEERRSRGIKEGEVAIGVIGTIVNFKLQVPLLNEVIVPHADAFRKAGARFHFLGGIKSEAYAQECREIVESQGIGDLVMWHGYIADMTPWYVALDLVAFPAPEGTARTLLEAAAFGVPAVARETSREVVPHGENGFLCAEVVDLGAPLVELSNNAELRKKMSVRGREIASERFDIHKNRAAYAAIYAKLIGR